MPLFCLLKRVGIKQMRFLCPPIRYVDIIAVDKPSIRAHATVILWCGAHVYIYDDARWTCVQYTVYAFFVDALCYISRVWLPVQRKWKRLRLPPPPPRWRCAQVFRTK